jgi:hypothetical protein
MFYLDVPVATLVGLSDSYLSARACGRNGLSRQKELAAKRFYNALIIADLVHEVPLWDVATR